MGEKRKIHKDVKSGTYSGLVRCPTLRGRVRGGGMPWPQTGATHYHAQLGIPDKSRAIKGLVVYFSWYLQPLDLLNSLDLGCYQPSP